MKCKAIGDSWYYIGSSRQIESLGTKKINPLLLFERLLFSTHLYIYVSTRRNKVDVEREKKEIMIIRALCNKRSGRVSKSRIFLKDTALSISRRRKSSHDLSSLNRTHLCSKKKKKKRKFRCKYDSNNQRCPSIRTTTNTSCLLHSKSIE